MDCDSANQWDRFRELMPVAKKWAYLDHSAVGPLPSPTRDAMAHWLADATENGDVNWLDWFRQVSQLRTRAAAMINADESEIALIPSTTTGINFVAEGYPWVDGDNVVIPGNEFPSNLFPWMHLQDRGVEVRQVAVDGGRVDPNRIDEACDERTRIVAVSWVGFATGWRIDVDQVCEIAHRHGALVMLDAIQGLGVYALDVQSTPVDFVSADGHKWMLAPEGAGVCYIRREHLDRLRPVGVGWNSVKSSFDFSNPTFELRDSAARYEGGTLNSAGFIGMSQSIQLLMDSGTGPDKSSVGDRVIAIASYAIEQLKASGFEVISPREPGHESGIVTFACADHDPEAVRTRCLENGIVLSCRGGGIRISPHAYVNHDDIDRLIDTLRRM